MYCGSSSKSRANDGAGERERGCFIQGYQSPCAWCDLRLSFTARAVCTSGGWHNAVQNHRQRGMRHMRKRIKNMYRMPRGRQAVSSAARRFRSAGCLNSHPHYVPDHSCSPLTPVTAIFSHASEKVQQRGHCGQQCQGRHHRNGD